MPIYTSKGKRYEIPQMLASIFESENSDAVVEMYDRSGVGYNVPIEKQSLFKRDHDGWSYDKPKQQAQPAQQEVAETIVDSTRPVPTESLSVEDGKTAVRAPQPIDDEGYVFSVDDVERMAGGADGKPETDTFRYVTTEQTENKPNEQEKTVCDVLMTDVNPLSAENVKSGIKPFKAMLQEDDEVDKMYTPKQENTTADVTENYRNRYALTEEGKQKQKELRKIYQAYQEGALEQFEKTDDYANILKMYDGTKDSKDKVNQLLNDKFAELYGDQLQAAMVPYFEAYDQGVFARYGARLKGDIEKAVRKGNEASISKLLKEVDVIEDSLDSAGKKMNFLDRLDHWQYTLDDKSALAHARRLLEDSQNVIRESKVNKKDDNIVYATGRGIRDNVSLRDFTFGISELADERQINDILSRMEKGERVTPAEEKLIEASSANMITHAYYDQMLSTAYKAGQETAESLPFMLEFVVNPIAGSGKAMARGLLKYALKKWGGKGINAASKFAVRLGTDELAAVGMTATTGLAGVEADATRRMNENYDYGVRDGQVYVEKAPEQLTWGEARQKAFVQRAIENQSEMVFNAFGGALKTLGGQKYLQKIASSQPAAIKTLKEIAERTQFHGMPVEYMEEVYNNGMNVLTGEMTVEEFTDIDKNIETFLGLAPTSVAFGMLGLGTFAISEGKTRKKLKNAYKELPEDLQILYDKTMASKGDKADAAKDFLKSVLTNKNSTKEQKEAACRVAYGTIEDLSYEDAKESGFTPEEVEKEVVVSSTDAGPVAAEGEVNKISARDVAYGNGYGLYQSGDAASMRRAYLTTLYSMRRLREAAGEDVVERIDNAQSQEEIDAVVSSLPAEKQRYATDYAEKVAMMNGLDDAIEERWAEDTRQTESIIGTVFEGGKNELPIVQSDAYHVIVVMNGMSADGAMNTPDGTVMGVSLPVVNGQADWTQFDAGAVRSYKVKSENLMGVATPRGVSEIMLSGKAAEENQILRATPISVGSTYPVLLGGELREVSVVGQDRGNWLVEVIGEKGVEPVSNEELELWKHQAEMLPIEEEYANIDSEINNDQGISETDGAERDAADETGGLPSVGSAAHGDGTVQGRTVGLSDEQGRDASGHKESGREDSVQGAVAEVPGDGIKESALSRLAVYPEGHAKAGRPDYESSRVEDVRDYLLESLGEEKALKTVNSTISGTEGRLKEKENFAKNFREEMENSALEVDDMLRAQEQLKAVESEVAKLQKSVDYWKEVRTALGGEEVDNSELDENGRRFVLSSDGTTIFGEIREESGLSAAPIKLSEGYQDKNGKGYGLKHIEANHGEQIRNAGFSSVEEFVSYVAKNYDENNIRVGNRRTTTGDTTYLIQVSDAHDNTLYIELSRDGSYWNVNSGGIFRKGYSNKKETVVKTEPQQPNNAVSTGSSLSEDVVRGIATTEPNGEPTVSLSKDNAGFSDVQEKGEETAEQDNKVSDNTLSQKIADAESEVNTTPTEAQKEAGNYKKGHVQIGTFNVTIEQPKGSVRSGVDKDGKKWETTMQNTYGYIRGTEGVDGDHIDVFLADDMDGWDGKKVFVVDQYNPDGTFDEHKVMLGFNDIDEAYAAYLSNYEEGWSDSRKIVIRPSSLEDFEKWINSSHRKTKPFAEYKSVEEQRRKPLRERVAEWANKLGIDMVVLENLDEVTNSQAREAIESGDGRYPGWYGEKSGKVYIYLPHVTDVKDIDETVVHEVVAHKGLRRLMGEKFDALCDMVWNSMSKENREKFMSYPGVNGNHRAAADEYMAYIAEKTELTEEEQGIWDKIVQFVKDLITLNLGVKLSDAQIAGLIRASYAEMKREAGKQKEAEATDVTTHDTKNTGRERHDELIKIAAEAHKAMGERQEAYSPQLPKPRDLVAAYEKNDSKEITTWKKQFEDVLSKMVPLDIPMIEQTKDNALYTRNAQKHNKDSAHYKAYNDIVKMLRKQKSKLESQLTDSDRDVLNAIAYSRGEGTRFSAKGYNPIAEKEVENIVVDTNGVPYSKDVALNKIPIGGLVKTNIDTGKNIKVSRKSLRHSALHDLKAVYAAFDRIEDIVVNAVKIGEIPVANDEIGKTNSVSIFYIPINIDGVQYSARLVVKELINKDEVLDDLSLYNMAMHKEKTPSNTNVGTSNDGLVYSDSVISVYKVKDLIHNTQEIDKKILGIDEETRFRSVYHGSAAEFDMFDHSHMGEGEGAQAYGWGTYVTDVEGIGRTYAKTMRDKQISDKHIENAIINKLAKDILESTNGNKDSAIEYLNGLLNESWSDKKRVKAQIKIIETGKYLPETKIKAHLYSVEIPDDNGSNYLHWEKNVPKDVVTNLKNKLFDEITDGQGQAYIEDMRQELDDVFDNEMDGSDLYGDLSAYLGGDRQTSEFLNRHGFVGISYPAEARRGGRADGARNFVIFNEADAKIEDRVMFRKVGDNMEHTVMFRSSPLMKGLRELEDGETCDVERIFTENKYFEFSGVNKIKSYSDVAYIFKQLEDESVENAFAVLVKRGKPTVIHLGMGHYTQSMVNKSVLNVAVTRMNPDKIYFVHNHPSGRLKASAQDVRMLQSLQEAYGSKMADGIIINTRSGQYGVFNEESYTTKVDEQTGLSDTSEAKPLKVYTFSKQVFSKDYQPGRSLLSSEDVARFVSSHRLGDRKKLGLIISNNNGITGNIFLPYTDINKDNARSIASDIIYYTSVMGGTHAVMFGNTPVRDMSHQGIGMLVEEFSGLRLLDYLKIDGGRYESASDEGLRFRFTGEEQGIIDKAKANGTWMKAPNGQPTNLNEKQWAQVRTKAFKKWFGDWEKVLRIEKLRKSENANIEGYEIVLTDNEKQNKKNAIEYGKTLKGEYVNTDTGKKISLTSSKKNGGLYEILEHDYKDREHLLSIAAIPQIIEKSIYIDTISNEDKTKHPQVLSYDYYLCGLKIGNEEYTVKAVISNLKDGSRYYDHKLTAIEKGRLVDIINKVPGTSVSISTQTPDSDTLSAIKDKRLLSILQVNSSKVVDANGEPLVVYHGTTRDNEIKRWNEALKSYDTTHEPFYVFKRKVDGERNNGFFFNSNQQNAYDYGYNTYDTFLNIKNPLVIDAQGASYATIEYNNEIKDTYEWSEYAEGNGFDGVIFNNIRDGVDYNAMNVPTTDYVAFRPNQIKSATENNGDFSGENNDIRFRVANRNQVGFVSNAMKAVEGIKQEKATPQQWLAMIEKQGGLKAGEDKWLGLSDWLKSSDKKTLTKDEVLDFIGENMIRIEEVKYGERSEVLYFDDYEVYNEWQELGGDKKAFNELAEKYGYDFTIAFSYDETFGIVNVDDAEAAMLFGGYDKGTIGNPINSTRLDYTTEGLDNKREIALTVPTIESWNEYDDIHFGDAGDGRAVAWIRFGEATTYENVDDVQQVTDFHEPYKDVNGLDIYKPIGSFRNGDFIAHGKGRNGDMIYVVYINGNQVPVSYKTLDDARVGMNEYYKEHPRKLRKPLRVLVIDEIQSKRHQEGRKKGYKNDSESLKIETAEEDLRKATKAFNDYRDELKVKYDYDHLEGSIMARTRSFMDGMTEAERTEFKRLAELKADATRVLEATRGGYISMNDVEFTEHDGLIEGRYGDFVSRYTSDTPRRAVLADLNNQIREHRISESRKLVPSAPFEKNWHELAMKRMLRLAAEEGFDKVAWTTGAQQAERYNMGKSVDSIESVRTGNGRYRLMGSKGGETVFDRYAEKDELPELVGKELAMKMTESEEEEMTFTGEDLQIGGQGMKGFYDRMLPSFVNKYVKKWGAKVGEVELPELEESAQKMWSVDVTEQMKAEVEEQVMFSWKPVGGNNGYVGYSMSKRAAKARAEGKYPKTDFKKEYDVTDKVLDTLVDAGIIDDSEWHHTSSYGNRTTFYGWAEPWYADYYAEHKAEIDKRLRTMPKAPKMEDYPATQEGADAFTREMDVYRSWRRNLLQDVSDEFESGREAWEEEVRVEEERKRKTYEEHKAYLEFVDENTNVPEEFNAKNGVRVVTHGKKAPYEWEFYWGENPAFKKYANAAREELVAVLKEQQKALPSFEEWKENNDEQLMFRKVSEQIEDMFDSAISGDLKGKPIPIGKLTVEGKEYLELISGLTLKNDVDFVLNPSDLVHIYNDHYGTNEKDKGNNIPLTKHDIKRMVDVVAFPSKIIYGTEPTSGRNLFYFLMDSLNGTYNLLEVYANKKGNLTAKTYYKTKKDATQRVMELSKTLLPTSKTYSGAILSKAKVPQMFESANIADEKVLFSAKEDVPELMPGEDVSDYLERVKRWKRRKASDEFMRNEHPMRELLLVVDEYENRLRKRDKEIKSLTKQMEVLKERLSKEEQRNTALVDHRKMRDYQELREEIEKFIRKEISSDFVSAMNKTDLNGLLKQMHATNNMDELENILLNVDIIARKAEIRYTWTALEKLLSLRVQNRNKKNMSIARSVDDSTRRIFTYMRGTVADLKLSGYEEDMRELRKRGNVIAEELASAKERLFNATEEEKQEITDLIDELNHKDAERKKILSDLKVEAEKARQAKAEHEDVKVSEELAALESQYEEKVEKGTWTRHDEERLLALNLMQMITDNNVKKADVIALERAIDENYQSLYRLQKSLEKSTGGRRQNLYEKIESMQSQLKGMKMELSNALHVQLSSLRFTVSELKEMIEEGRSKLLARREAETERKRMILRNASVSIRGKHVNIMDNDMRGRKGWRGLVDRVGDFLILPLSSFEYMVKAVSKYGEDSWLYDYFVKSENGVLEAYDTYVRGIRSARNQMDKAAIRIFGKNKTVAEVMVDSDRVQQHTGVYKFNNDELPGKGMDWLEIPLSKGQAMYIYMVWKMKDGRSKLMVQGFRDDSIKQIRQFIGEEYIAYADWIQNEFLPELRQKYNDKYLEIYDTSLAEVEHYVPLRIRKESVRKEGDLSADKQTSKSLEERAGSLINRVVNVNPVDVTLNGFAVIAEHVNQMEEWNAYARVRKDLDYLLGNNHFRNQLNTNEPGSFERFYEAAAIATASYRADSAKYGDSLWKALSKYFISGNIAYRLNTALKQFLSFPAFIGYDQHLEFIAIVTKRIGTVKSNMKWAKDNLPSFAERLEKGSMGDEKLDEKGYNKMLDAYTEIGMMPNKYVDAFTCSVIARSIYEYRFKQMSLRLADMDLSAEERRKELEAAHRLALREADIYYNATQQSSHPAFLSPMQLSRTFIDCMMTVYQNSNIGYVRQVFGAYQELCKQRNKKQYVSDRSNRYIEQGMSANEANDQATMDWWNNNRNNLVKIALFGWGLNLLWNLGSQGLLGLMNGDDDEDSVWEKIKFAMTSPVKGLPLGNLVDVIASGYRYDPIILFNEMNDLVHEATMAVEKYGFISPELAYIVLSFATKIQGIDLDVWGNIYMGIEDMIRNFGDSDRMTLDMLFILNSPKTARSQVVKYLYKDKSPLEFADALMRARKYVPEDDTLERWVPGNRPADKRQANKALTEYDELKELKSDEEPIAADEESKPEQGAKLYNKMVGLEDHVEDYAMTKGFEKLGKIVDDYEKLLRGKDVKAASTYAKRYEKELNVYRNAYVLRTMINKLKRTMGTPGVNGIDDEARMQYIRDFRKKAVKLFEELDGE